MSLRTGKRYDWCSGDLRQSRRSKGITLLVTPKSPSLLLTTGSEESFYFRTRIVCWIQETAHPFWATSFVYPIKKVGVRKCPGYNKLTDKQRCIVSNFFHRLPKNRVSFMAESLPCGVLFSENSFHRPQFCGSMPTSITAKTWKKLSTCALPCSPPTDRPHPQFPSVKYSTHSDTHERWGREAKTWAIASTGCCQTCIRPSPLHNSGKSSSVPTDTGTNHRTRFQIVRERDRYPTNFAKWGSLAMEPKQSPSPNPSRWGVSYHSLKV